MSSATTWNARERTVFERIFGIARLAQVTFIESTGIDDDQPARPHNRQVHLERRRVHHDQHIGFVAGGVDGRGAEIDLEGRDAECRALRRADFRRDNPEKWRARCPQEPVESVNWLPDSCMPSPESPAKRTTADSRTTACGMG